ncbi:MAG: TIGR04086 family membrane protein [Clostridia bacterium]|nr:TIGR04086 family membrane protein [Clostridia bacterium]
MKSKPFAKSRSERGFAGSLARGVLLALLFTGLLLLLLSFISYKNADPSRLIKPCAAVGFVLAAFLSGFLPARFYKRRGLLIGLSGGTILALTFAVLSLILAKDGSAPAAARWIGYPAILLLSTFGGLLGGAKRHVRRRRPKF